jgi:hypothetical protein
MMKLRRLENLYSTLAAVDSRLYINTFNDKTRLIYRFSPYRAVSTPTLGYNKKGTVRIT